MPSGPLRDPDRNHLWVILTDPCPVEANLIVSISTLHLGRFHDPACVIEAGAHRKITVQSWAVYKLCRAVQSASLTKGEAAWLYRADEPVSNGLYEQLCKGVLESEHIAPRLRRYFEGKGPPF
jgi:hypothetical protein